LKDGLRLCFPFFHRSFKSGIFELKNIILHRGFSPVIAEYAKGKEALAVNTGFNRNY
jgi:hypothetical protein